MYHLPVLLNECIDALNIRPDGVYVDATFGGGGHSRAILEKLDERGKLYGFDQDEDAAANAIQDPRFQLLPYNFSQLQTSLRLVGVRQVDGILADLGVSSHQLDTAERGFSYRFNASLDMRMSRNNPHTAAQIIAKYSADQLQDIFGRYGEVRNSKTLAQALVKARQTKKIETIQDLLLVVEPQIIGQKFKYLGQVFQALRMEVNAELDALKALLQQATQVLAPQGRLAVITFHSLEEKLVKNWIRYGTFEDMPEKDFYGNFVTPLQPLSKKVIEATETELAQNSRSHSAKLRVAEKK